MSDDVDDLGPIDYLVAEFPENRLTGEGLRVLVDLVERGVIRVLDLVFVHKQRDGQVVVLTVADLDGTLDLAIFEGASSGLLGCEDIEEAGAGLQIGSSAAILVYENLWAAALRRGGVQLVAEERQRWILSR